MVDLKASAFAGRWLAIATPIALVQIVIGAAVHATKLVDTTTPRIILPLYIYPEGDAWNPLFTAIKNNPTAAFTIVINPDSGPGQGTDPGADYSDNIKKLRATADTNQILELVGYVATGYGDKDPGLVKSQVLQYHNWTSAIRPDGIFFDETSTSSKWLSTYSGYTDFVKSLDWGVDTSSVKSITAIVKPVATSTRSTSTPKAVSTSKPKSTNKPTSSQKPKSTKKASTSTKKPKSTKTAKKPTSKRKTTNKHKRSNQNTAITILNPGTWPEDPRFYSTSADHIVVYESPLSNFDYAEYQSLTAGSNAGSDFQRAYIFNEVDPRNIATKDGKKFASIQQLVDGTIHGLNSTGGIFVSDLGEPQVYTEFSNVWQEFVTDVVAVST
ncbi:spherulin 4-like cell surface protein [Pseudozyma hubeiensis SY62]|uniref:Spherulin 4-like cell surface protein n=1 Tax=Pseudozyma hubeiensis (strain SY62) TaxID=1305764 RepID=R9P1L0_PSEHS|nr:spherulin 4-like cell surface protein [Pseudozyma hubeiensis SY62]GAC95022.1 spherulin 4-like cell surface protein [Pseudozyma hubeiensis SY62]